MTAGLIIGHADALSPSWNNPSPRRTQAEARSVEPRIGVITDRLVREFRSRRSGVAERVVDEQLEVLDQPLASEQEPALLDRP